jgi:hypothetical protein
MEKIINTKAEINKQETKRILQRVSETKSYAFENK